MVLGTIIAGASSPTETFEPRLVNLSRGELCQPPETEQSSFLLLDRVYVIYAGSLLLSHGTTSKSFVFAYLDHRPYVIEPSLDHVSHACFSFSLTIVESR